MTRFEIIVEVNGVRKYLDTEGVENISLNYNIADIITPDKRNSSYSKTIKVPETRNNRSIFGDISDLTIDSSFNPNKKSRCWILADTIVVLEGYLQLRKISMDWRYDYSFYECVVFADNDGFFKELNESYLRDLVWSELDHEWGLDEIRNSWTASWTDGYFYPLIDYGYNFDLSDINQGLIIGPSGTSVNYGVDEEKFFPATNVKYIVDKIFDNAGYNYISSFFETNEFKNLYIPYNGSGKYERNPNDLSGRFSAYYFGTYSYIHNSQGQIQDFPFINNGVFPSTPNQLPQSYSTDFDTVEIIGNNSTNVGQRIIFDLETPPGGDPDGVWNPILSEYTAPANVTSQRFSYNFDIEFPIRTFLQPSSPSNNTLNYFPFPLNGNATYPGIQIKRTFAPNGVAVSGGYPVYCGGANSRVPFTIDRIPNIEYLDIAPVKFPVDNQANQFPAVHQLVNLPKRVRGQLSTDLFGLGELNHPLVPGEKVWVEFFFTTKSLVFRGQLFELEYGSGSLVGKLPGDLNFFTTLPSPSWNALTTGLYPLGLYPWMTYSSPFHSLYGYSTTIPFTVLLDRSALTFEFRGYFGSQPAGQTITSVGYGFFFNNLSLYHVAGDTIPYVQNIPNNIKQKDFIISLIKLFNLYIEPTKDNPRILIIEPRDEFYEQGTVKDWTLKLDTNANIDEIILAETQNKSILLTYKQDKDFYNEDYFSKLNDVYGEYEIVIDNDFTTAQRKIEPIFSPTPLIPLLGSDEKIVIPKIGKLNNGVFGNTDHNIRILTKYTRFNTKTWVYDQAYPQTGASYYGFTILENLSAVTHNFEVGDLIQITNPTFTFLNILAVVVDIISSTEIAVSFYPSLTILINFPPAWVATGSVETYSGLMPIAQFGYRIKIGSRRLSQAYDLDYIPYLGHLDNPQNSRYDLNFGQTTTYFRYDTLTNNNLYNLYYKNQFDDIVSKDSKLITAQFYLTAADIADFTFRDKIYIKNQYFKVNKISNYDPTKEKLTQVELIKSGISNVIVQRIQSTRPTTRPIEVPGESIEIVERASNPFYINMADPSNDIKQTNSLVGGVDNFVYAKNSVVIGTNNKVAGSNNFIAGEYNDVDGETRGNLLIGNNNHIVGGISNAIIFGSDTLVTNSNTVQINSKFIVTSNYISASKDEVLNMYFDNKPINYLSASRDMVREWGSQDPINFITSGIDVV